ASDDASRTNGFEDGNEFTAFAECLRGGENEAAQELLARYSARLVGLARRKLGKRLAVKVDPDDVLQSVFRTFFRRLGGGHIELRDWESLTALLSLITLCKCQRQQRCFGSAKRDLGSEISIQGGARTSFEMSIPDREPTPQEVAAFTDLLERILERIDERDGEIIRMLLAGDSVDDIARRFRRSRRTVQRSLARIRQALLDDEE
ncbi:MAG: ECF-type sigma factor, partial [Planctomycetota bacterium]|nr:ECF-type sigma factor [Planctomycetota bacterium]